MDPSGASFAQRPTFADFACDTTNTFKFEFKVIYDKRFDSIFPHEWALVGHSYVVQSIGRPNMIFTI
jgi:hypothetical protein